MVRLLQAGQLLPRSPALSSQPVLVPNDGGNAGGMRRGLQPCSPRAASGGSGSGAACSTRRAPAASQLRCNGTQQQQQQQAAQCMYMHCTGGARAPPQRRLRAHAAG